ncbi:MAG: hypothetical protein LBF43_00705 [Puniceicoccales bacterium]|jgi:hypothetical protein|nr:hypothetical protein [Puniceicoccales bacterium]
MRKSFGGLAEVFWKEMLLSTELFYWTKDPGKQWVGYILDLICADVVIGFIASWDGFYSTF